MLPSVLASSLRIWRSSGLRCRESYQTCRESGRCAESTVGRSSHLVKGDGGQDKDTAFLCASHLPVRRDHHPRRCDSESLPFLRWWQANVLNRTVHPLLSGCFPHGYGGCFLLRHRNIEGEVFYFLHQSTELTHLHEPFVNEFCVAAERHLVHLFLAKWRETSFAQHFTDFIESYLVFKIIWINHGCKSTTILANYQTFEPLSVFLAPRGVNLCLISVVFLPVVFVSSVPNVTQESCSAKVPSAQLGNKLRNDAAKGYYLFVDDAAVACIFQISVGEGM